MVSKPLKASVIGVGMSATVFHIPFILHFPQYFILHSVLERSATADKSVAREKYIETGKVPKLKIVNTLDDVIKDPEVDVVVVSTPNSTHEEYTEAALNHGKHVILEKPSFTNSKVAQKMFDLAKSKNLMIAVYQNRRFDCDFLTLRKVLDSGVVGEISEMETRYDRFRSTLSGSAWKESALPGHGVVWDLGSHLIDQILFLFGAPTRISTPILQNSRSLGPAELKDNFLSIFHYKGDKIPMNIIVRGSILSALETQERFVVKGTKGSWIKWGLDVQEPQLKLNPPMEVTDARYGVESKNNEGTLTTLDNGEFVSKKIPTEKGDYTLWYAQTGQALQSGDHSKLVVSPKQAVELIKLIEYIYQSHVEGGKAVEVVL